MDNVNDKTKGAQDTTDMSAEAYLSRLGERGIEYVFANAGAAVGWQEISALHHGAA